MLIRLTINGDEIERDIDPTERLIDFLREDLNLTGTKEGCSEGECGACTVIINNDAVTSCSILVGQVDGDEIITIEGLERSGELDIIQNAFIEKGAIQCGFCTPGMIMSCKALLIKKSDPTVEEIKTAIEGNLCRCTGYTKIVEAVESVVKVGLQC